MEDIMKLRQLSIFTFVVVALAGACTPPVTDEPSPSGVGEGEGEGEDGCAEGTHDGGDAACVATGTCSPGFEDGGDGTCLDDGTCSPGFHDGGDFVCVAEGDCSAGQHNGGAGDCVADRECSFGFHDGGNDVCVELGTCSGGFHLDRSSFDPDTFTCIPPCEGATHDCGLGACTTNGCCSGFENIDGICLQLCSSGFHRSGSACVPEDTCGAGFHDGRGVVDNSATCPIPPPCTSAVRDSPLLPPDRCPSGGAFSEGYFCAATETCWHSDEISAPDCGTVADCKDDGPGAETICPCGQHADCNTRPSIFSEIAYFPGQGGGISGFPGGICVDDCVPNTLTCVPVGTCSPGFHDDGTGNCAAGACSPGFHDDGDGGCVANETADGVACVDASECAGGFCQFFNDGQTNFGQLCASRCPDSFDCGANSVCWDVTADLAVCGPNPG